MTQRILVLGALLLGGTLACRPALLPQAQISVGGQSLTVELAISAEQRATGLMKRKRLADDQGMLFVFSRDQMLGFYMKDTTIPLSIAYIDRHGVIREIYPLEPLELKPVIARWPARYALEVNRGWFARHGISVGAQIELPASLSASLPG